MVKKTYEQLESICELSIQQNKTIDLSDIDFSEISPEQIESLSNKYSKIGFLKMPQKEIDFFEWLKSQDSEVWDDLWAAEGEEPYIVSFGLLPLLLSKTRGFPICDLVNCDNYYFTEDSLFTEEGKAFKESAQERFLNGDKLTPHQAFVVELCASPVDIWRFAYRYGFKIEFVKQIVLDLQADKVLAHLKKREQIADLVRFNP